MASLKVKKEIKLIDEYNSKGNSRLYRHKRADQLRKDFYKKEGSVEAVLDYIFGSAELPEDLEEIIKSIEQKEPLSDTGLYIYDENEIQRFGVPPGEYILRADINDITDSEEVDSNEQEA